VGGLIAVSCLDPLLMIAAVPRPSRL